MPSWFGRSKRPEWILQPEVTIYSSSFDPYRTRQDLDDLLGVGEWKIDSVPLTDRYEFFAKKSLPPHLVDAVKGIVSGNSPSDSHGN